MMTLITRRAVAHKVLNSERFEAELTVVAKNSGMRLTEACKEAYIALRATVSLQIPFFGFLLNRGLGPLHTRAAAALAGVVAIGELDYRMRHRAQHLH
jgi:hypothetical protein